MVGIAVRPDRSNPEQQGLLLSPAFFRTCEISAFTPTTEKEKSIVLCRILSLDISHSFGLITAIYSLSSVVKISIVLWV